MSKAARHKSARERLAEERRRRAEKEKRLRALMVSLGALAVIAVIVVGVVVYQANKDGSESFSGALAPVSRQADGSVVMAKAGVQGPVLDIYEDFQCPACEKMEATSSDTIKRLAAEGRVKVVYRPFSLFRSQPEPVRGNSERALNASFCAPADKWIPFHDKLFKEQGPETKPGFSTQELVAWGKEVGITDPGFGQCVTGNGKKAEADKANAAAQQAGVQSTPWVVLNGKVLGDVVFSPRDLEKAITKAPAGAPKTSQ